MNEQTYFDTENGPSVVLLDRYHIRAHRRFTPLRELAGMSPSTGRQLHRL